MMKIQSPYLVTSLAPFTLLLLNALIPLPFLHAGTAVQDIILDVNAKATSLDVPISNELSCSSDGLNDPSLVSCIDPGIIGSKEISEASYKIGSPKPVTADRFGSDMGEPQIVDVEGSDDIEQRIADARRYLRETVMVEDKFDKVRQSCKNKNSQCAFWASVGECENNPAYMHLNCGPVCFSCDVLHVEARCPLDPHVKDAFAEPGDLNDMFERIITDPYYLQFQPVVLSRPDYAPGDTAENATYKVSSIWMVMFENFATAEEAARLIELGGIEGFDRSADVGEEKVDGTFDALVNSGRTSTNAWCQNECYEDPVAISVMDRIANVTGIAEPNSENLQLLRYEQDQFYQTHNDYIHYQKDRPCGVRILTFYIYLNDVEAGGGTDFPNLGLTVSPKLGRAVLWPSVFNSRPNTRDSRSDHQALPVLKGTKYGANAWIHQRDFKNNNKIGCA